MQTMKFEISEIYKQDGFYLPNSFLLNKTIGLNFDPYKNLVQVVFEGQTRVDRK